MNYNNMTLDHPILYSVKISPETLPEIAIKNLVILHGFLGMSDNWKTLGAQYANEGYHVHLLDLRNHGRSFHASKFSYDIMAEDVSEYCKANNIAITALIGHSMGGKVAMLFATLFPEKVTAIVVADIGTKHYKPHHQEILKGLNAVDFSLKPDRNQVDAILKKYVEDMGTRQFLLKNLYRKAPGQLAFRFNLENFNSTTTQIGTPLPEDAIFEKETLFVRGGNSSYIKDKDLDEIKKHFPKVVFETIPNAGHWLHAENPALFFQITSSFLKENTILF